MINRGFKIGFTVAEIAVSMFIITGIAMLMLPSLINDSERQTIAASLGKSYTQLQQVSQSMGLMMSRGRLVNQATPLDTFWTAIPLLMKTVPSAKHSEYISNAYNPANLPVNPRNPDGRNDIIVLKSGIYLFNDGNNIIVDVNGRRQPNRLGRDIFFFDVVQNASIGAITVRPANSLNCNPDNNAANATLGCANRIINIDNGKVTY